MSCFSTAEAATNFSSAAFFLARKVSICWIISLLLASKSKTFSTKDESAPFFSIPS